MKRLLFLFGFLTGIIPIIPSGSRMYYLVQQAKTWTDAQTYCRTTHKDLAIIKDSNDMVRFQEEAVKQSPNTYAWIGMYVNVNSWHWSYGNVPLGPITAWHAGEPNNWHGHEECVVINNRDWKDKPCTTMFGYMCMDSSKTLSAKFIHFSNTTTWLEAQTFCRQYYTDLATITDLLDNIFAKSMVTDFTWMGLVRDSWKWVDQSNFSSVSWVSGQPDNAQGNEDCGCITNSQVADAACADVMPFFCYSDISKRKQIVRVKVQSTQDVNAPEVKNAILEQIKQKIELITAESILVKWTEKPGGDVFLKEKANQNTAENVNGGTCTL